MLDIVGQRPYRLGILELGLGYLASSLVIPAVAVEIRIALSVTLGSALGGLLFYTAPLERFILPAFLRITAWVNRSRLLGMKSFIDLLSSPYMANSVAYVVGGWYACVGIGLILVFPPLNLTSIIPIEFIHFIFGFAVICILAASILELKLIPGKLRLVAHYESLIRHSSNPSLLEQTYGASLVRGDFEGDARRWSRRWAMGEEYIRIRPFLIDTHGLLGESYTYLGISLGRNPDVDVLQELNRFRAIFQDRIKRTQLDTDFLKGGYGELLRDLEDIAKVVEGLNAAMAKRLSSNEISRRQHGAFSHGFAEKIKRAVHEMDRLLEHEMSEPAFTDLGLARVLNQELLERTLQVE